MIADPDHLMCLVVASGLETLLPVRLCNGEELNARCAEQLVQHACVTILCRLEPCSAGQFWNYLRRQLYVMDTYCNAHNRSLNHTMLALHSYLSWAFILPLVLTVAEVLTAVLRLMTPARFQVRWKKVAHLLLTMECQL